MRPSSEGLMTVATCASDAYMSSRAVTGGWSAPRRAGHIAHPVERSSAPHAHRGATTLDARVRAGTLAPGAAMARGGRRAGRLAGVRDRPTRTKDRPGSI